MTLQSMASATPRTKPPLGSGQRFAAVERSAAAGGARNPGAVAYAAGVKAHGKSRMVQMAQAGRKRNAAG